MHFSYPDRRSSEVSLLCKAQVNDCAHEKRVIMAFLTKQRNNVTNIIHLLHECEGNLKICSPKKNHVSRGLYPREIWFFHGNKSSYFPHTHAIKVYYSEQQLMIQHTSILNNFSTCRKQ